MLATAVPPASTLLDEPERGQGSPALRRRPCPRNWSWGGAMGRYTFRHLRLLQRIDGFHVLELKLRW